MIMKYIVDLSYFDKYEPIKKEVYSYCCYFNRVDEPLNWTYKCVIKGSDIFIRFSFRKQTDYFQFCLRFL